MIHKLLTQKIHVKPVKSNSDIDGWLVVKHTAIQAFFDDWRRYGFKIAYLNLMEMLK